MAEPHYQDADVTLHLGDCLDVLAAMEDDSIDAVCTDPPYGLEFMGREWDGANGFRRSLNAAGAGRDSVFGRASRTSPEYVAGPLFQRWCQAWAAECLRVLKPGGHLLAFGGTRTWHRLVCGIEDAGFEVRDAVADLTGYDAAGLMWVYGSGFPKSLDVSKAIDKRAEENVETKRRIAAVAEVIRTHREAKGMTPQQVSLAVVGTPSGACWNWEHQQLPSVEMWPAIKAALGIPGKYDGLIEGDRARFIAAEREVIGQRLTGIGAGRGDVAYIGDSDNRDVTAPATEDAARWEGWGTALKPGWEPIAVGRKPLGGTVAGNVLEYGTGALNIDGCRVDPGTPVPGGGGLLGGAASRHEGWRREAHLTGEPTAPHDAGRWPPNVVLGSAAAGELDRQSGGRSFNKAGKFADAREGHSKNEIYGARDAADVFGYGDTGGASRFFPVFRYEAKAPASERPRAEDGTAHPTVKPVDLMRWLVRLVTPPDGLVLDPFAGSGTTAEACIVEGFRCVLAEKDPASAALIVRRLRKPIQPVMFGDVP